METNQDSKPRRPPIVPIEYAGKWIVWDRAMTRIVANGRTLGEAREAAKATGEPDVVLEKVPKLAVPFIGTKL